MAGDMTAAAIPRLGRHNLYSGTANQRTPARHILKSLPVEPPRRAEPAASRSRLLEFLHFGPALDQIRIRARIHAESGALGSGALGPGAFKERQLLAKSFPDGARSVSNRNRGAIRKGNLHPRGCLLFPLSR